MGLFPINPFIRRTVRTQPILYMFNKPKGEPQLFFSCMRAYRTFHATLGFTSVLFCDFAHVFVSLQANETKRADKLSW